MLQREQVMWICTSSKSSCLHKRVAAWCADIWWLGSSWLQLQAGLTN